MLLVRIVVPLVGIVVLLVGKVVVAFAQIGLIEVRHVSVRPLNSRNRLCPRHGLQPYTHTRPCRASPFTKFSVPSAFRQFSRLRARAFCKKKCPSPTPVRGVGEETLQNSSWAQSSFCDIDYLDRSYSSVAYKSCYRYVS